MMLEQRPLSVRQWTWVFQGTLESNILHFEGLSRRSLWRLGRVEARLMVEVKSRKEATMAFSSMGRLTR